MELQSLVAFLFLVASGSALALDKADEGIYALVHRDGHITQKIARLSQPDGHWRLEDRKPDGSWEDVTCEDACALAVTTPDQVAKFLQGTALDGIAMECVHDQAFAFCRSGNTGVRSYYMLAFSGEAIIPLKWVRLNPDTLEPAGAP
jgi:hypothetical protein